VGKGIIRNLDIECYNTYIQSMTHELRTEIRQSQPFKSLEQEAHLNVLRTASVLSDGIEQVLKPAGLTGAQFNVLRILRGAEPEGLCRNDVRDRMVSRMPDMTRMLDRMEAAGLVSRCRDADDRRQVNTRISPKGLALLEEVDELVSAEHRRRLGHMSEVQLKTLIELAGLARDPE
jgi:DNA-binding MarR family transcriptional regulator